MEDFFATLMEFCNSKSIWTYLFIFFGKILEVSISTLRIMLVSRGERVKGTIAMIFEFTLWLFITGTVLSNFQSDIVKIFVLIGAVAVGTFVGSWLEEKLAFGICTISVYMKSSDEAHNMADILRSNGHAVTLMDAEGIAGQRREVLTLTVMRKLSNDVLVLISRTNPSAMVTVTNTSSVRGGFLKDPVKRVPSFIHRAPKKKAPVFDEKQNDAENRSNAD